MEARREFDTIYVTVRFGVMSACQGRQGARTATIHYYKTRLSYIDFQYKLALFSLHNTCRLGRSVNPITGDTFLVASLIFWALPFRVSLYASISARAGKSSGAPRQSIDLSSPCIYQGGNYYYVDCLEKLSEARLILMSPLNDCEPLEVDTESSISI
jgi:hypothetical protein